MIYKGYDLSKLCENKPHVTTEFGKLVHGEIGCLLYYCDIQKQWTMVSPKTGIHQIEGKTKTITKQVQTHWNAFLEDQSC